MLHSGTLLLAYAFTWQVIMPVQANFLTQLPSLAMVMYLPFGIKVISAFFEGWRSMVYLAPGAAIGLGLFTNLRFDAPLTYLTFLASYGAAPAVFCLLDWALGRDRQFHSPKVGWRILLFGGLVTSVVSPVMIHLVRYQTMPSSDFALSLTKYMVGDIVGLVAVLFLLLAVFRLSRA
ncbi:hypothetical protein [Tateyamaria sp. SN3-11]|uniref:hypothetical protein n=1 Tax=Tateyamaria sp. SN3-11 TaxID=3092147 RepID=UPI0039E91752